MAQASRGGAVSRRGGNSGGNQQLTAQKKTSSEKTTSTAMVPRNSRTVERNRPGQEVMLAPKGYTMREIQPAKNYDVVSFARAMNDDFGPKVKKLFDPEREAALDAQETGIYIGWRCPQFNWDCQRVGRSSKCFCGHLLAEHNSYNGQSVRVPCHQASCGCKAFAWAPSRPEDVGEFWLPKRRGFDPATWRMTCRCKHTHEEHDVNGQHRCHKCRCGMFSSSSVCAACDGHWEQHETFFETERDRREKGLPYGEDYLPFAEIPSLRNMVLNGEDDGDMSYMQLQQHQLVPGASNRRALPPSQSHDPRYGDRYAESSIVPYHSGRSGPEDRVDPRYGHGRYSEHSGVQQDYSHFDQGTVAHGRHSNRQDWQNTRNQGSHDYGNSEWQGRHGGFRPTYD